MTNHVKPTEEELQQGIDEALALADTGKPEDTLEPEPEKEEPKPKKSPKATPEPEPKKEPTKEPEEAEPSKELYKKKFSESSKENQKIYAKNRIINKALVEADEVPEPTEEELKTEYNDWEIMSEVEKQLAKETVISRRWRGIISKAKEQATKIEKWNDSVDEFVEDPKTFIDNPDLEGKADEFREFATQEANNSVPMKVLVSAFLFEQSKNNKPHKGRMFETGSGGPNDNPRPKGNKLTLEESRVLRETDYNAYKEALMSGKIQSDL